MSVTNDVYQAWNGAQETVRHLENLLDAMGLLKRRTEHGTVHPDRLLKSVEMDKEGAPADTQEDGG